MFPMKWSIYVCMYLWILEMDIDRPKCFLQLLMNQAQIQRNKIIAHEWQLYNQRSYKR